MRVLQLTQEFPPYVTGGVAYHSYNLAKQLSEAGHDVTVFTTDSGETKTNEQEAELSGIHVERISPTTMQVPRLFFARAAERYLRHTDVEAFDFVHSHEFLDFDLVPSSVPVLLKIHYNVFSGRKYGNLPHDNLLKQWLVRLIKRRVIAPYERQMERESLSKSDARVYVSTLTKDLYKTEYSHTEPRERHRVIPNGVDLEQFTVAGKSSDEDYFLAVTGGQERKGYDVLVDAFEHLSSLNLKIAGSLKGLSPPEHDNIEALGHVSQSRLAALYRGATALVHPAKYEPFGNVVLESLASGTPVIVSGADHCGATAVLRDSVRKIVDPYSPEMVRSAVRTAHEEPMVGSTACRESVKQFTWRRVANETIELAETLWRQL